MGGWKIISKEFSINDVAMALIQKGRQRVRVYVCEDVDGHLYIDPDKYAISSITEPRKMGRGVKSLLWFLAIALGALVIIAVLAIVIANW